MALILLTAVPIIACLASLLVRKTLRVLTYIAVISSLLEIVGTVIVVISVVHDGTYRLNGYLYVDSLGAILLMILALVGGMASLHSVSYLKIEMDKKIIGFRRVRQYFVLLNLFILAMFFAIMTANPILMWIAVETTTLSTAFLISFYNKPSAMEAAWKYLIVNSVGLLLGFLGTLLFLYPELHGGFNGLVTWHDLLSNASAFDPAIARIAFIFVLIGFGTKVGLVPMHTWLPDAHSKAPAPVSSLLSGVLLNVAFLAVLRFKAVTDLAVGSGFSTELLIGFGIVSIVISAFIIYIQKNYKRLLAYHSVEHMGIITLGFGFGGAGAFAALSHMIYHALAKSALFLSAGDILLKYSSTKMVNIRGMIKILPVTSILFFVGFLVMAGVPPFGIFITEFSILSSGISHYLVIVVIALLAFGLVFAGILKHVVEMIFGEPPESVPKGEAGVLTVVSAMILIVVLVGVGFYIPTFLHSLLQSATANY
jgi:hydrogenase-4 component F